MGSFGQATRLLRVDRTVGKLDPMVEFYTRGLGFELSSRSQHGRWQIAMLQLGDTALALTQPAAADAYPKAGRCCDPYYQHVAVGCADITATMEAALKAGGKAVTKGGPQAVAGGGLAWKLRDPEGHPLQLLQAAGGKPLACENTAICVSDLETSLAFYRDLLGLRETSRETAGRERDALDGLSGCEIETVTLAAGTASPRVELTRYLQPAIVAKKRQKWLTDAACDRMVFAVDDLEAACARMAKKRRTRVQTTLYSDGGLPGIVYRMPDDYMIVLV